MEMEVNNMSISQIIEKLINNDDLSDQEASWVMNETMDGNLTPSQIAAWLVAARIKGETPGEITQFATIMRDKAVPLPTLHHSDQDDQSENAVMVDTCGTGGDKSDLINISTLSALVLSSLGITVAKHGNRAVSSKSGSADILEQLGYPMDENAEQAAKRLTENKFAFLFAPSYHPAMKHAGPVRKELGIRTVFNILGPLSNPANADIQLLGVYSSSLLDTMIQCLHKLNIKAALVVHSEEGLDEISPVSKTHYRLLLNGNISEGTIDASTLGLQINSLNELVANSAEEALDKAKGVLNGTFLPGIETVALNCAATKFLYDNYTKKTNLNLTDYLADEVMKIKQHILDNKVKITEII